MVEEGDWYTARGSTVNVFSKGMCRERGREVYDEEKGADLDC